MLHDRTDRCSGAVVSYPPWKARAGVSPPPAHPTSMPWTGSTAATGAAAGDAVPSTSSGGCARAYAAVPPPWNPPTAIAAGSMRYSPARSRTHSTPAAASVAASRMAAVTPSMSSVGQQWRPGRVRYSIVTAT
jgi:hypothetical protein